MEVILHFGAHRTSTTTFQRMMGRNGPALRAAGLAYWGPKRTRSGLFEGLLDAPRLGVLPWRRRRGLRGAARVGRAMDALRGDGIASLLVSEENMLGSMRLCAVRAGLYEDLPRRAGLLAMALGRDCPRIGLAIRSYETWWASVIGFALARGGPVPSDELTALVLSQPRRWRDVICDLGAAFPAAEIVVWQYETRAARPELTAEALFGPGVPEFTGVRNWHNASPGPAALRGHLRDLGAPISGIREEAGRFMPFDRGQRSKLQADYAEDIAWLRSGAEARITHIDEPGENPAANGHGRGHKADDEGRIQDRQMG